MKKFFVLLILAIMFASFSFGQSSYEDRWAAQTSQKIAKMNGLKNPNLIFPNKELALPVPGLNYPYFYNVVQGDCLWYISKRVNRGDFGEGKIIQNFIVPTEENLPIASEEQKIPYWEWLILLLLLAALALAIYLIIKDGRRWRNSDPVTSGPAQIPGGINDNGVSAVITSRHPNCRILSIEKGKLYGRGVAHYNFNRLSTNAILNDLFGKDFNGEVGYQARIVTPSGEERIVQTLMGCGNEIRNNGKFLTGLTFIPDNEQPEVLAQQTVVEPKVAVIPTLEKEVEQKTIETSIPESEIYKTVSAHTVLAKEFLETQTAHKVTLKVTTPQGTVETILETKTVGQAQQKTEEKKG